MCNWLCVFAACDGLVLPTGALLWKGNNMRCSIFGRENFSFEVQPNPHIYYWFERRIHKGYRPNLYMQLLAQPYEVFSCYVHEKKGLSWPFSKWMRSLSNHLHVQDYGGMCGQYGLSVPPMYSQSVSGAYLMPVPIHWLFVMEWYLIGIFWCSRILIH